MVSSATMEPKTEATETQETKAEAAPKKSRKKPTKEKAPAREMLYEKVGTKLHVGDNPITAKLAKQLLGWTEVDKDESYVITDREGKRIQLANNLTNRPLYPPAVETYVQEILRGRWAGPNGSGTTINGEPIIVGQTGILLNGQHQLVSLIFASQEHAMNPDYFDHWKGKEPVIDKLLVVGISESDEVVNTMDTAKPRTLADVIYRSPYFADLSVKERKNASRMLDYAIKLVWHRTGVDAQAYAPHRRTHSESIDFLGRHPKLVQAVKFINSENGENAISNLLSPGSAAGLLYLMACGNSDAKKYHDKGETEKALTFDLWNKAEEFFSILAHGTDLKIVTNKLRSMIDDGRASSLERQSLLVKAWNKWSCGEEIKNVDLRLKYSVNDEVYTLNELPTVGGIDVGEPLELDEEDDGSEIPSEEEVEAEKKKIRAEKSNSKNDDDSE